MGKTKFNDSIKNNKGSLTVEACLAFPVFLCFFLLLAFFIRIACINITLNHAAKETAKQLATSSYPLAMLNEMEDELLEEGDASQIPTLAEELQSMKGYLDQSRQDLLSKLLTGKLEKSDINDILNSIAERVRDDYAKGVGGYLTNHFAGRYFEIKTQAKYKAAEFLMNSFCEGSFVNRDRMNFTMVELPSGNAEFEVRQKDETYQQACRKLNYSPCQDDVVISVEYRVNIPLPVFGKKEMFLRQTAVEKAWLHGSNGVFTLDENGEEAEDKDSGGSDEEEDNLDKENKSEIVYITKTGIKYHKKGCWHLAKSKKAIRLPEAEKRGYTPCKHCHKNE